MATPRAFHSHIYGQIGPPYQRRTSRHRATHLSQLCHSSAPDHPSPESPEPPERRLINCLVHHLSLVSPASVQHFNCEKFVFQLLKYVPKQTYPSSRGFFLLPPSSSILSPSTTIAPFALHQVLNPTEFMYRLYQFRYPIDMGRYTLSTVSSRFA